MPKAKKDLSKYKKEFPRYKKNLRKHNKDLHWEDTDFPRFNVDETTVDEDIFNSFNPNKCNYCEESELEDK